ncbi:MAG: hypothetical protein ACOCP2_01755 [Halohasta sp.]
MADSTPDPRNITTDHETIREWVEARDGQPAHTTGQVDDDAASLYIVQEDEEMEGLDSLSWDEFFETFEAEELAFVYQDREVGETDEWLYDLVDRAEVAERASLDSSEIEEALLEGEVVESEITETKVIEKTVVETDRIQSEIVDSELVETTEIDRETIGREVIGVTFADAPENLTPRLRSEPAAPTADEGETDHDPTTADPTADPTADEGDATDDSTTPQDSPVDDPADKTVPDPPVERRSTHREEADRTATSEESMRREATGQQPGERRGSDRQSSDVSGADRGSVDEASTEEASADEASTEEASADDASTDRQPVDETTAEPASDRQSETEAVGLAVGDGVVLDVQDTVRTTTEVFDRKTVESRVVEQEITEEDTVESDAIDIEGIEETLLESDVIEGEVVSDETGEDAGLPTGAITTERTEGDTIRSQFVERRLVETESTDHHRLTADISDTELVDIIEGRSTIVERAIVDREADEEAMLQEPEAGVRTTDEQISAAEESATTPAADAELAAEPDGEAGETGATGETGEMPATEETGGARSTEETAESKRALTDDEVGKQVVSADEDIGIVSDVDTETQTLYVEPEPSLADRIKAALDWGDTDDSYPVGEDQIEAVDDDEVRISKQ